MIHTRHALIAEGISFDVAVLASPHAVAIASRA
ncbi:hypothetical protein Mnod_6100 [Methylobacterium nodulans ORS 2060]|uniref:Uncharacterized protein n=1 Tax=Methylobacterium nodulans (strain LMG 21967 / CNCM I-2342 / ORS 2060) TaxID=460265 RepID=B8IV74_METNO|nr:hypothetical protein Mnod_6100 [Methylobacterium nodulans ORS 2060]